MNGTSLTLGCLTFTGSITIIALILWTFGLMLGITMPADALKHTDTIMGITMMLKLIPGVLVNASSCRSLWRRIGLTALGVSFGLLWRASKRSPMEQDLALTRRRSPDI